MDFQTNIGYLETTMRYIFSVAKDLTKTDVEQMIRQLETTNLDGGELAMTLADMWREEGIEIGGTKALSETAILLLTEKFGIVPQNIKEGILLADTDNLKVILMNIFKFKEIDEVRRYIQ